MRKAFFVLVLAAALFMAACNVRKPVMPEWDVELNVPLMAETFFVSDLVDSVNIVLGDGNILTLQGTGSAETPAFGDIDLNPDVESPAIPILSGIQSDATFPFVDSDPSDGTVQLSYGQLVSGVIGSRFQNVAPETQQVTVTFTELRTPAGAPFEIAWSGNSGWTNNNLEGCTIGTINSGQILQNLHFSITATSSLPNGTQIGDLTLRANSNLAFGHFQGHLDGLTFPLEESASHINVDYPYDIDEAIQLQEASLAVTLTNRLKFHCQFNGQFYAVNNDTGEERYIDILDGNNQPYMANPATNEGPGTTHLNFTNGIEQLLQIMPDEIEIRNGFFVINSSASGILGEVRNSDTILGDYTINAPFIFELFESTIRLQDPIQIEISQENRDRILNNALGAELTLNVLNTVPVGATATVYIGNTEAIDPADPDSYAYQRPVTLHSKQFVEAHIGDPAYPEINSLGEQIITVTLSEAEVDVFAAPLVYLLWTFSFEDSDGVVTVTANTGDFIRIKSMIKAGLHISEGGF
jgi:hypothetical protein